MYPAQKVTEVKKRSTRQGDPVDAEDLIRRLNAYLAEQEAKASRSWDMRFRRSRGRRDQVKCNQKSPLPSDNTTTTTTTNAATMIRSNSGMMNLISQPLLRYQKTLENKTCEPKRKLNNHNGLESIKQHPTQSHIRYQRNQYQSRNFKSCQEHDEDSDQNFYSPKRMFHIHTILRHKSRRGLKSGRTSSEATTEDSRNSNEMCRADTENPVWLSHEQNSHSIRKTTSHLGKRWDWTFAYPSKRLSRDYSLDKSSIDTTEILSSVSVSGSRNNIRSGFMALFRKNSST